MYKFIDNKIMFIYDSTLQSKDLCCPGAYTYNGVTWHWLKYHLAELNFTCVCGDCVPLIEIKEIYYTCFACERYFYLDIEWMKEFPPDF